MFIVSHKKCGHDALSDKHMGKVVPEKGAKAEHKMQIGGIPKHIAFGQFKGTNYEAG